jgi:hypothetical protein
VQDRGDDAFEQAGTRSQTGVAWHREHVPELLLSPLGVRRVRVLLHGAVQALQSLAGIRQLGGLRPQIPKDLDLGWPGQLLDDQDGLPQRRFVATLGELHQRQCAVDRVAVVVHRAGRRRQDGEHGEEDRQEGRADAVRQSC